MIIITLTHPGQDPATHRFESPLIRLGREEDNDLVLDSFGCSRYHAEIRCEAGVYKIRDCGSMNGIEVDGSRVEELVLETGSEVTICEHTLTFSFPAAASARTVMMPARELMAGPLAPQAPQAPPVLHLHVAGQGRGQTVKIAAGVEYVLGRSPGSDVVLEDSLCSGRHALIFSRDAGFFVRDMDSANGTLKNGDRVREAPLTSGDRLTLGGVEIAISDQGRDAADDEILLARTQLGMPAMQAPQAPAASAPAPAADLRPRTGSGKRLALGAVALAGVVLVAVLAGLLWKVLGPHRGPEAVSEEPAASAAAAQGVRVRVHPVVQKDLAFSVEGAGSVQPHRRVTVSSEVAGRILEIPAEEGAIVRPGDLLVRLDDREIRLQIQEAGASISRHQVDLAREEFERRERLFNDGALTRSALNQAENHFLSLDAAYRTAQARIAQLRERAGKTRLSAPFRGTVAKALVNLGELAGPGTPLMVIEDVEEVLVVVAVSDREVIKLRPLQAVEATSDAFPGRIFQGVVERIDSTADPVSRGFEVEARIGNPDGSLRSGMITSIHILHDKHSALVAPAEALLDENQGRARVLVVEGGVARSVEIEIGGRLDRDVEVLRGLAAGDEVIVFGHQQVVDGQPVQPYRD